MHIFYINTSPDQTVIHTTPGILPQISQQRVLRMESKHGQGESNLFSFFFPKILFIFRDGGREGEREGEKHHCVVASHAQPIGGLAATQACALT